MKTLYLSIIILFLLALSSTLWGQTIYNNSQDGKLYFKVSPSIQNHIILEGINVNIEKTKFLNEIDKTYDLIKVEKAFVIDQSTEELDRIYLATFSNPSEIDLLIAKFERYNFIEYAERVPFNRVFHTPNDPLYTSTSWGYNWNWHLDLIHATQAWDISTGNSNIKVAVVDNAIWSSHPDLQNKIVSQASYVSPTTNSSPPTSISQTSSVTAYEWSHGTHCAGLVAGQSNNNIGIASIGYNVSLLAYRASDNAGDLYYTSYGEQWASNNNADVISMSYGSTQYSSSQNTFYNTLKTNGIVLVAAAGNEGDAGNEVNYPAGYAAVISVAAANEDLSLSYFSQHGTWIDIAAPGGFTPDDNGQINIPSTTYTEAYYLSSVPDFTGSYYDGMQGTSMATPITAGLCGLLLSINPSLTPDQVKACLMDNAQALSSGTINANSGCIDAYASAQCANSGATPNANFSANQTNITVGTTVNFTDLSTGGATSWAWNFGDGGTATQQNPSHLYNAVGDYTVTLTINGVDTETKTNYIHVTAGSSVYCPSSGSTTYGTSITKVQFNTINNSSGQTNAYQDYTSISTDVQIGNSYNLSVNVNTDGNYTIQSIVWIDWNHDFDFDDIDEEYIMGSAVNTANGPTSASPYNVTIPATASLGSTRMRVSAKYNAQATACEENYDGEVEDYTVNITNPSTSSCDDLSSDFTMGFETGEDLTNWSIEDVNADDTLWTIYNSPANAHTGNNMAGIVYNDNGLTMNDYIYTPCFNLIAGSNYELSFWYRVYDAAYFEKLEVRYGSSANATSMNNTIVNLGTINNATYLESVQTFTPSISGEYYLGFHGYSLSDNSNGYYIFVDDIMLRQTSVGISNKASNETVKIYPNPNNGEFSIDIFDSQSAQIQLFNLNGELIANFNQKTKTESYTLSNLNPGVYIVKIISGDQVNTDRIIIK